MNLSLGLVRDGEHHHLFFFFVNSSSRIVHCAESVPVYYSTYGRRITILHVLRRDTDTWMMMIIIIGIHLGDFIVLWQGGGRSDGRNIISSEYGTNGRSSSELIGWMARRIAIARLVYIRPRRMETSSHPIDNIPPSSWSPSTSTFTSHFKRKCHLLVFFYLAIFYETNIILLHGYPVSHSQQKRHRAPPRLLLAVSTTSTTADSMRCPIPRSNCQS